MASKIRKANSDAGKADRGMPMAGKSTLNRLELAKAGADADSPYCKIVADLDGMAAIPD